MILAAIDPVVAFAGVEEASGVLTEVMGAFTNTLKGGGQQIVTAEAEFAGALIAYQYLKLMMNIGFSKRVAMEAVFTFIVAALWYQVAMNAVSIVASYMEFMGSIGSLFSAGTMEGNIMGNPSLFMELGLNSFKKMLDQSTSFTNPFTAGTALLAYFVLGFLLLAGFLMLGCMVVYVVVRSSLEAMLGLVLVPFVIERDLRFLAGKGFSMIIDAGMRLGATSIAVGVSYGVVRNWRLPDDPTIRHGVNLMAACVLCLFITGMASMLKSAANAMR